MYMLQQVPVKSLVRAVSFRHSPGRDSGSSRGSSTLSNFFTWQRFCLISLHDDHFIEFLYMAQTWSNFFTWQRQGISEAPTRGLPVRVQRRDRIGSPEDPQRLAGRLSGGPPEVGWESLRKTLQGTGAGLNMTHMRSRTVHEQPFADNVLFL